MSGGTVSDAAKRFNIPRTTLRFRLKSDDPVGHRRSGAPPALSEQEEQMVVEWVLETARMGQPLSWKRLSVAVKEMLDRSGHTKVFANNNMPSSGWLRAFKKRHPNLATAKTDDNTAPDTLTQEDLKKWFVELQTHLKEEGLDPQTFLQPHNGVRIFSSEEVVVMLQGEDRLSKVLTQKGKRNVPKFCSPGRKMITVMTCINAAGSYLRPFVVFEGRKIPLHQLQDQVDPTTFDVGFSKRGGIDHELFGVWIEGLINYLDTNSVQRPVLLLLDNHTCHIDLNTCELAKDNGLIMHLLPPHASQLMQPVDVGIFRTLKVAYRDSVDHYIPTHGPAINKKHFPMVFVNAWRNASVAENAISGFQEAGLVPLNLDMIDTTKIVPKCKHSNSGPKTYKDRAPGRPLYSKGSKSPRRSCKAPGNEYIRGLSDALDHIIHNFVSEKIRPIYEKWIQEEKSCTPDPVFYIWGSLKSLIEENTKKQSKISEGSTTNTAASDPTSFSIPPSVDVSNNTMTAVGDKHTQPPSAPPYTCPQFSSPTPHLLTGPSVVYQNMTHVVTPLVPWDHNLQASQNFNRYFATTHHHQQQQQPAHNCIQPTTMTIVTAPPTNNSPLPHHHHQPPQPLVQGTNHIHTAGVMTPNSGLQYYTTTTTKGREGKCGEKRQWMEKEGDDGSKRQMVEGDKEDEDSCGVYDGSNYSARIGLCMQDQNVCPTYQ